MEYSKDEVFEVEYQKKGTSNKFLKTIVILTIIFSAINCICIYDFYRLLCNMIK